MARVVNQISINGSIERVFDAVTTARYWPQWHPATIAVSGVTDRPVALGDVIRERAQIGARVYEGDWTVAEHARPSRVVLRGRGAPIQIAYTFGSEGQATTLRRELDFQPEDFLGSVTDPAALESLMDHQSEAALHKLKQLVEELLATSDGVTG
jgi:hypothetical protein